MDQALLERRGPEAGSEWKEVARWPGKGSGEHTGGVLPEIQEALDHNKPVVALESTIDGLIHISRLGGGRRIHHPREVLEEGQEIEVKVESLDPAGRKMSLAPADYVSPENIEENERGAYRQYVEKSGRETAETRTGSLGDLLKARLAEKNPRSRTRKAPRTSRSAPGAGSRDERLRDRSCRCRVHELRNGGERVRSGVPEGGLR